MASLRVTDCASDGPRLLTVMAKLTVSPGVTVVGLAMLVIWRSADVRIVAVAPAVLFCRFVSVVSLLADARSVMDAPGKPPGTRTTMVTVAVAPLARVSIGQVTVPPVCVQVPELGVA